MEHAEARELLEIAAIEPRGFARLVAGDTPEAAALAGHLAGCSTCAAEMDRLRRSAVVIRDAVRLLPPPELRDRTLAYVAAVGRPRGQVGLAVTASDSSDIVEIGADRRRLGGGVSRPGLWVASLAAAVLIAVVGTAVFVGGSRDRQIAELSEEVGSMRDVAAWTVRVDRQADARHVALAATDSASTGTLIFSPTSTDVVVVATGLPVPADGMEYRCWVETAGKRQRIGKMFLGDGLAYWVGSAASLTGVGAGTTFGISIVPVTGDAVPGRSVLVGQS